MEGSWFKSPMGENYKELKKKIFLITHLIYSNSKIVHLVGSVCD